MRSSNTCRDVCLAIALIGALAIETAYAIDPNRALSQYLRDRWGVPWQIVPTVLPRLLAHEDRAVAARVFAAMSAMVKLDVAALERAAKG